MKSGSSDVYLHEIPGGQVRRTLNCMRRPCAANSAWPSCFWRVPLSPVHQPAVPGVLAGPGGPVARDQEGLPGREPPAGRPAQGTPRARGHAALASMLSDHQRLPALAGHAAGALAGDAVQQGGGRPRAVHGAEQAGRGGRPCARRRVVIPVVGRGVLPGAGIDAAHGTTWRRGLTAWAPPRFAALPTDRATSVSCRAASPSRCAPRC